MNVLLRSARDDDAEGVAAIYAPIVRDTPISFEIDPPSVREMLRRIGKTRDTYPFLVCADGDDRLGYAYATQHRERAAYRWSVEVSVYVAESARGRRVGTGLYGALLAILGIQGFHRAYAGVTLPNPASVGLHESLGFAHLGVYKRVGFKAGAWYDVGWWDRDLAEPSPTPEPPTPFAKLATRADVTAALAAGARAVRRREAAS